MLLTELFLLSCSLGPTAPPKPSVEEQERLSLKKFEEVLEATANLPQDETRGLVREGFYEIIEKYPDSYLAEESYLRLILSYLEDFYPPEEKKAEELYREYFQKYPNPKLGNPINEYMARFYYRTGNWEKLVVFTVPYLRNYVKTGKLTNPLFMFFYSEAKFNMNDLKEARIGYKTLIRHYPNSHEAKISKDRLNVIQSKGF
jgi:tetratricopeptide (TPR) repeat protein